MSDAILINSMKTIIRKISKQKKKYTENELGGILQKQVFDLITK